MLGQGWSDTGEFRVVWNDKTVMDFHSYMPTKYRHKILTFLLEKEKLFRFDHISIGFVGKTE